MASRYWRLLITAIDSSNGRVDVWELELRQIAGGTDETAPGMTTSASESSFGSPNVIDNDPDSFWGSPTPGALPAWIQIDLGVGGGVPVQQWSLRHGFADFMPRDVELQASDDAVDWLTVDSRSDLTWSPPETKIFDIPLSTSNPVLLADIRLSNVRISDFPGG